MEGSVFRGCFALEDIPQVDLDPPSQGVQATFQIALRYWVRGFVCWAGPFYQAVDFVRWAGPFYPAVDFVRWRAELSYPVVDFDLVAVGYLIWETEKDFDLAAVVYWDLGWAEEYLYRAQLRCQYLVFQDSVRVPVGLDFQDSGEEAQVFPGHRQTSRRACLEAGE